jgi:Fe-S cluster biogenesis protein NfuA
MDKEKVKQVIEKIEDDGTVKVRLLGHCAGCMHAQQTLTFGVERAIKQFVPEVTHVVNVA